MTGAGVTAIRRTGQGLTLDTARGAVESRYLVNCAGLYSDEVARLMGIRPEVRIIPFRGEYYMSRAGLPSPMLHTGTRSSRMTSKASSITSGKGAGRAELDGIPS